MCSDVLADCTSCSLRVPTQLPPLALLLPSPALITPLEQSSSQPPSPPFLRQSCSAGSSRAGRGSLQASAVAELSSRAVAWGAGLQEQGRAGQGRLSPCLPHVGWHCQGCSLIGFHQCGFCASGLPNQIKHRHVCSQPPPESSPGTENAESLRSASPRPSPRLLPQSRRGSRAQPGDLLRSWVHSHGVRMGLAAASQGLWCL